MSACTVVIGHREAIVAEGLAAALARCPGVVPIGTGSTPGEVIRLGQKANAVAVDAEMRDADSVAATLRRSGVRVVFLGSNGSDDESVRVSTGARVAALAAALNPRAGAPHRPGTILTGREHEVLSLVAMGLAGKQVARHLGISPKTVERHKTKIFSKLGVPNAAAAVGFLLSTSGGGTAWIQSTT
jgi:DNA-binding CsgD family transcriptional regulator